MVELARAAASERLASGAPSQSPLPGIEQALPRTWDSTGGASMSHLAVHSSPAWLHLTLSLRTAHSKLARATPQPSARSASSSRRHDSLQIDGQDSLGVHNRSPWAGTIVLVSAPGRLLQAHGGHPPVQRERSPTRPLRRVEWDGPERKVEYGRNPILYGGVVPSPAVLHNQMGTLR